MRVTRDSLKELRRSFRAPGLLRFVCCSLLLAAGCTKEATEPTRRNLPPETYLSIQAGQPGHPVTLPDTVASPGDSVTNLPRDLDYRLILHWWGSDPDGRIQGYYVRWTGDWAPPHDPYRDPADTTWVFTTATTDTFPAPTGVPSCDTCRVARASGTFWVRAVDDQDLADPTSSLQTFRVRNLAPRLDWDRSLPLQATTLPATSFAWHAVDLDGRGTVHRFRYWLDGSDSLHAFVTSDTLVGLSKDDFQGRYGQRTLSVQAIDESETPSNTIRHSWTVLDPPTQRYLLIDNVAGSVPGAAREDGFYRALMDSAAAGDYYILDFEQTGGLRTDREAFPTFSLFRGVVWYSGVSNAANDASFARNLTLAQGGLGQYLDRGGRFLLLGTNAVGDSAGLSLSFARDRLGVSEFFRVEGSSNIDLVTNTLLTTEIRSVPDTLKTTYPSLKADFMRLQPGVIPLFSVPPGFLSGADSTRVVVPDQSAEPARVGALLDNGTYRLAVVAFLLSRSEDYRTRDRREAAALFRRLLLD